MTEYRNNATTAAARTESRNQNAENLATGAQVRPHHSTLASRYYGVPDIQVRALSQSAPQAVDQGFNAYSGIPSAQGMHPLAFWEVRITICIHQFVTCHLTSQQLARVTFLTIYAIALDYLPIQASVVPCKRVFSSSSETNMKKRNRISPLLMEALQMLKFWLKKDHLNFTKDWITPQQDMAFDEDNDDLLAQMLSTPSLDEILTAIARVEGDDVSGTPDIF